MKKRLKCLSVLAAVALMAFSSQRSEAQCQPVTINISTGISDGGNILPVGTPDPNWQNSQGQGNVTTPNSGWSSLTGSAWLGNGSTGTAGNYTYTRNFTIPGGGTLSFQALADNYVTFFLDGVQIAQTPNGPSIYGFQLANAVNYSASITGGAHILQAVVNNQGGPVGLNLSGTVSYTPTPVTVNISTGVVGNLLLAPGNADPNWQNAQGLNVVVNAYPGWDSYSGATWLGHDASTNAGIYTFTRTFNATSAGTISFNAMADNNVVILLDGNTIAQTPGGSFYGFQFANAVSYTGSFGAGTHTISAQVNNIGGPVGFTLEGSVSYCDGITPVCDVEPSFTASYAGYNTASLFSNTDPNNQPSATVIITHSWDFGDGSAPSSDVDPLHTFPAAGTYWITHTITKQILGPDGTVLTTCQETRRCRLTISNGDVLEPVPSDETARPLGTVTLLCKVIIVDPAARKAATGTAPLSLYPNPARDVLHIRGNGQPYDLHVLSMDGREVLRRQMSGSDDRLDISSLAPGAYVVRILQEGRMQNLRFVKVQ